MPPGLMQFLGLFSIKSNDPWWVTVGKILIYIAIFVLLFFKSVQKIPSGQFAIKRRFGRVMWVPLNHRQGEIIYHTTVVKRTGQRLLTDEPVRVFGRTLHYRRDQYHPLAGTPVTKEAGVCINIPFADTFMMTSCQQRVFNYARSLFRCQDPGNFWNESATIFYRVIDPFKALIVYENIDEAIQSLAASVAQRLIKIDRVPNDRLTGRMVVDEEIVAETWKMGVVIDKFFITASELTPQSQLAQAMSIYGVGTGGDNDNNHFATLSAVIPMSPANLEVV